MRTLDWIAAFLASFAPVLNLLVPFLGDAATTNLTPWLESSVGLGGMLVLGLSVIIVAVAVFAAALWMIMRSAPYRLLLFLGLILTMVINLVWNPRVSHLSWTSAVYQVVLQIDPPSAPEVPAIPEAVPGAGWMRGKRSTSREV